MAEDMPEKMSENRPDRMLERMSEDVSDRTAISRFQWALPDFNCELQVSVGTAGPQPAGGGRGGEDNCPCLSCHNDMPNRCARKNVRINVRNMADGYGIIFFG